jgi:hypothetical protein
MKNDDIEADRARAIARLLEGKPDKGERASLEFRFGPGGFGCQEALHASHIIVDMIQRHLIDHPSIILNADWYARARRAQDEIGSLYQTIGEAHVADDDQKASH